MHRTPPSFPTGAALALVFALTSVVPVARADEPRFEVTPFGAYRVGGEFLRLYEWEFALDKV